MKILTVIGARPQFIKSAAISRAIQKHYSKELSEITVHTGQHFDENMSGIFFKELNLKSPDYRLQDRGDENRIEDMRLAVRKILEQEKPDAVLVYGDTDSTLAGALAGHDLHIPIVHVEAGLRSFNDQMPEEKNRIKTDQLSTLLFTPSKAGMENLKNEGFLLDNAPPYTMKNPGVYHCGDVMYDNSLYFAQMSDELSNICQNLNLPSRYLLATVHRNYNTDNPQRLKAILESFVELVEDGITTVFPMHPRTNSLLKENFPEWLDTMIKMPGFVIIPPVSFLDIIALEKNAAAILTDSGGMQKEAFFFKKPCIILREETEWVELVENGNAKLCGADKTMIVSSVKELLSTNNMTFPPFYGNGDAASFICSEILKQL